MMKGLKVLVLANDTTYAFNLRDELLERLVSDGNEVVVASQPLLYQDELKGMGCRLIDIETNRHGKNPLSDLGLLSKFKKLLKVEKLANSFFIGRPLPPDGRRRELRCSSDSASLFHQRFP